MKCEHDDCFTCPYSDCIIESRQLSEILSKENEEKRKRHRINNLNYYYRNQEKCKAYQREYERKRRERLKNGTAKN